MKSALVNRPGPRLVQGYLAGIGGTNVDPALIERVVLDALKRTDATEGPIWMKEED